MSPLVASNHSRFILVLATLILSARLSPAWSQSPTPNEEKSAYFHILENIYKNRSARERYFRRDVFDFKSDILPMKEFFIRNATIAGSHDTITKKLRGQGPLACVNTVRAGLEILFYGRSEIEANPNHSTTQPLLKMVSQNRMVDVMELLSDSGCINDYKDVYLYGRDKRGDTVIINEQTFCIPGNFSDTNSIINIAGSVWYAILSMVPRAKGWSVFGVSLSNGYHAAMILVNHTGVVPEFYWADQTGNHPVADGNRIAIPINHQFGWERFTEKQTIYRSLDDYCLYAARSFLFDKSGNKHMPVFRIFRISRPASIHKR